MKQSLYLVFKYITIFLIMVTVASYLHMQEAQLTLLVAGKTLPFFNLKLFAQGFLTYFHLCCAFSILPFCFYFLRHKYKVVQYLIPYIIICILVFFVIFPLGMDLQNKYADFLSPLNKTEQTPLSEGYFRSTPTYLDYYISTNEDGSSEVLHIPKSTALNSFYRYSPETITTRQDGSTGFSDPLIFDIFGSEHHVSLFKEFFAYLEVKMKDAYRNGFLSFFLFMSIGFALSSIIGLRRFAKWRLLNFFNLFFAFFAIIFINAMLYSNQFYNAFSFLAPTRKWLPFTVNYLIFAINTTIGIVLASSQVDPNRESE